jgi:large subunit ribosomal protein L18
MSDRESGRIKRHRRIRKRLVGFPGRPRMAVFRSEKHLYVQLINDLDNKTLLGCSTKDARLRQQLQYGGNVVAAEQLGRLVAAEALKRGIQQVVFDRGGYQFHGRVKAVAEAARQGGLKF